MKSLKNIISKTLSHKWSCCTALAENIFRAPASEYESYSEKWNYVRENPVRAVIVARAEEWPHVGEIFALEYRSEK